MHNHYNKRQPNKKNNNQNARNNKSIPARIRRDRRILVLGVFFTLAFGYILFEIGNVQRTYGNEYKRIVIENVILERMVAVERIIAPRRGLIVDRDNQPIVHSEQVYDIFIDLRLLANYRSVAEQEATKDALVQILGLQRYYVESLFQRNAEGVLLRNTNHYIVARQVPANIADSLTREHRDIHGRQHSQRAFNDPHFAPQIMGFIRGDAAWGLEGFYNPQLTGERGRTILVQGDVEEIPVRHGYTIVTTLDGDIQRLAQQHARRAFELHPSDFIGIIVMNPQTGEILAMAQEPTFAIHTPTNPTYFTDPMLLENWDYLTERERFDRMNLMWANYHITRSAEPGSVFKPIVMAAALEEGVISLHDTFHCGGVRIIAGQRLVCWQLHGHGGLTLVEALYRSCNIAMFDIMDRLGRDRFYRYRGYFGFGDRTGIDLPGETAVSSPIVMYPLHALGPVQLATSSMGQGFNATTLQSINAFAAVINGGNVMQPFIVSHVLDIHNNVIYENTPTVLRRVISQRTSDIFRTQMQTVVTATHGTGRSSYIPGHAIGGKTGTAQQGIARDRLNLTYIAYTSINNPEFLVLITIDNIHNQTLPDGRTVSSGAVVAPLMRDFFEDLIRMRNIAPSEGAYSMDFWQTNLMGGDIMPDFSGYRLLDVIRNLNRTSNGGGGYHVFGGGTIISHTTPAPGRPIGSSPVIIFHTYPETRNPGNMTIVPNVTGLTVAQAEIVLQDLGLPIQLCTGEERVDRSHLFSPITSQPEPLAYGVEPVPTAPLLYTIIQQFPAPDTEVERGTQVLLRVVPIN